MSLRSAKECPLQFLDIPLKTLRSIAMQGDLNVPIAGTHRVPDASVAECGLHSGDVRLSQIGTLSRGLCFPPLGQGFGTWRKRQRAGRAGRILGTSAFGHVSVWGLLTRPSTMGSGHLFYCPREQAMILREFSIVILPITRD